MLKVGYSDDYGIDIFAVKQGTVVFSGENFAAPGLNAGFLVHVVQVGSSHQIRIWKLARGTQQIAAANSRSNGGKANLASAGRHLRGQLYWLQYRCIHRRSRHSYARSQAHKISTCHR